MAVTDVAQILSIITRLDAAKPARFSYTQNAFDGNTVEGVDNFSLSQEQNIPNISKVDYSATILDRGNRSQGASIPRMALNHFFGRLSYNLAKLTQQVLAFFQAEKKAWAHNAFEYDAQQEYLTGDMCYYVGTINSVTTINFYRRISTNPLKLVGSSPVADGQTDWEVAELRTNLFPLLPVNTAGYRHRYSVVDLTAGTYDVNTWYPVTTAAIPASVGAAGNEDANALQVILEAYTIGAVSGQSGSCRAELSVFSKFTGFALSSTSIVLDDIFIQNAGVGPDLGKSNSPIGYSMLPIGKQAVMWLRGGSKYCLWNSFGASYTVRTASYNNGVDPAVVPGSPRKMIINTGKITAIVSTPDAVSSDEATNLSQLVTAKVYVFDSAIEAARRLMNKVLFRQFTNSEKNLYTSKWYNVIMPSSQLWQSVCWSPELMLFCAIASGPSNAIALSKDGVVWTAATMPSSREWMSVCLAAELGIFCAIAYGSAVAATSVDGVNWTERVLPNSAQWRVVCWAPEIGKFCAVSPTYIAVSVNGIDWTSVANPNVNVSESICWSAEKNTFVIVGGAVYVALTSPDGVVWTARTLPSNIGWTGVCWAAECKLFVAIAKSTTAAATSPDGITWSAMVMPVSAVWNKVCWSPDLEMFCATIHDTSTVYVSYDGTAWAVRAVSVVGSYPYVIWCGELGIFFILHHGSALSTRCVSLKEF